MSSKVGNDNDTLIIGKEQIEALCARLRDENELNSCIEEVRKMIDIKSAICNWADERTPCCGPSPQIWLNGEVQALEAVLSHVEARNINQAIFLLDEYSKTLPEQHGLPIERI